MVYSLEESGHMVALENIHLSSGNYETRNSTLADENANCQEEFERSYN